MRTKKSNRLKTFYLHNKWAIWLAIGLSLFAINQWLALSVLLMVTAVTRKESTISVSFDLPGVVLVILLLIFLMISTLSGNMDFPTCLCLSITSIVVYFNGLSFAINRKPSDIILLFTIIAIFIALPHILITVYDIFQNGLINEGRRLLVLDEDAQQDTTLRVVYLSLSLVGISYFFWLREKDYITRTYVYFLAVFSILSLLCCLHYLSRTGLVLFGAPIAISLLWPKRGFSPSTAFSIILFAITIYFFMSSEVFGDLFTLYEAREKDYSSMSNFGGRDERWLKAWNFIISNPTGATVPNELYAHNMWLDFGKDGGLISFLLFIFFSLLSYIRAFKVIISKHIVNIMKFTVAVFTIQLFLSCFTECIHEGARSYLYVYFLICGSINGFYRKSRRHTKIIHKE